jgi:hypothetical protein
MQTDNVGPFVIAHGDVWKRTSGRTFAGGGLTHVCDGTGEMAVAYQGDVLLKVGSADAVDAWHVANRGKFDLMREMLSSNDEGHDDLEVVVVKVPVSQPIIDEINLCVAISGRVAKLRENLVKIGADDPSLLERPRYPR